MDLTLYRVIGGQKRVALGDLADGIEFYTAEKGTDGVVTLTPVRVRDGRSAVQDDPAPAAVEQVTDPGDLPPFN